MNPNMLIAWGPWLIALLAFATGHHGAALFFALAGGVLFVARRTGPGSGERSSSDATFWNDTGSAGTCDTSTWTASGDASGAGVDSDRCEAGDSGDGGWDSDAGCGDSSSDSGGSDGGGGGD